MNVPYAARKLTVHQILNGKLSFLVGIVSVRNALETFALEKLDTIKEFVRIAGLMFNEFLLYMTHKTAQIYMYNLCEMVYVVPIKSIQILILI